MERFRTDVRHNKTEPKNYIALNRKKACVKNPSNLPPVSEAVRPAIQDKRVFHRREREVPLTGDVKRSIEQLASIISSGDLAKIIQLAKEIQGTPQVEEQPDHLYSQPHSVNKINTQPQQLQLVKFVEPSYVSGLDVESGNTHKRIPNSESPMKTVTTIQSTNTEPYYGRGQGLRQLLELDNAPPFLQHNTKQSQNIRTNELAKRAQVPETEYYPWGKPGAGAPLSRGYDVQQQTNLAIHQRPIQVNIQQEYSNESANTVMIRNSDYLRPEEERKRKASQYMLDLRAQVNEKERLKREEQERQAELDRLMNDKIARDQTRLLLEAEREKDRLNQKNQEAHKRFAYLQSKIEEQQRLAIAEKERNKKRHHTNLSRIKQNSSPMSPQPINSPVIQVKGIKPKKQTEQQTNDKQGRIRNPPPSQIHLIKSNVPKNSFTKNTKSSSMPTTRQIESEHCETSKNYLNVSSECFDHSIDASRPSTVATSIDRVILQDTNTQLTSQPNATALLQQQVYDGEVMRQLQKLKQGLHVKQQELHSNYF